MRVREQKFIGFFGRFKSHLFQFSVPIAECRVAEPLLHFDRLELVDPGVEVTQKVKQTLDGSGQGHRGIADLLALDGVRYCVDETEVLLSSNHVQFRSFIDTGLLRFVPNLLRRRLTWSMPGGRLGF